MFDRNRRNTARGENAGLSKLTELDVLGIREMAGTKKNTEIAKDFNVTPALIGCVINRKIWRHVA
jgi:hypothetical protein